MIYEGYDLTCGWIATHVLLHEVWSHSNERERKGRRAELSRII